MKEDSLRSAIRKIEAFCKDNDITVFYGEVVDNKFTEVEWAQEGQRSIDNFLKFAKAIFTKVIIIEMTQNRITEFRQSIEAIKVWENQDQRNEIQKISKELRAYESFLPMYEICFFYEGVCYKFQDDTEWSKDYLRIIQFLKNQRQESQIQSRLLPVSEIDKLVDKILADPVFLEGRNAIDRQRRSMLLARTFSPKTQYDDLIRIVKNSEEKFLKNIQPKLESELREKIKALKTKGYKKVRVKAELGITETQINRHWYD